MSGWEDGLASLRFWCCCLHEALDRKFVEIGQALAKKRPISTSRLAVVDGAGHIAHLERPDEFSRLVAGFLGGE
jgi:2-succinyl-6-hydroxy-2,4-cyclohexadiene-1-carboxylate synthase